MRDDRLRLDKWLWFARFFKSRSSAQKAVEAGFVRVNSIRILDCAHPLKPGDVLTINQPAGVRVVEVAALGERRGPAAEAAALYLDMTPAPPAKTDPPAIAAHAATRVRRMI
ncbi:MAG: RNA-binding S4 domain-containing protein [Methylobacteriaceae bacterium]|jgi:ribosome-associated heat shock protein Hsp15|nr:RNA-binding S4 domain-containing protein [Methylobacteriaceae bacterium]